MAIYTIRERVLANRMSRDHDKPCVVVNDPERMLLQHIFKRY